MYLSGKQGSVMWRSIILENGVLKIEHRSHGTVHERETNWKNVGIVPYSSHIKFPSQLINTYFHLNTHSSRKMLIMVWSLSLTLECEKVKGLIFHLFFSWQHACFWLVSLVSLLSLCWMYICLVTFNDQDDVNWWVITHAHTHTQKRSSCTVAPLPWQTFAIWLYIDQSGACWFPALQTNNNWPHVDCPFFRPRLHRSSPTKNGQVLSLRLQNMSAFTRTTKSPVVCMPGQ